MAQTHALMRALKQTLKAHGLTYREVAAGLRLSEASVKRLFAEENLSLSRLDQICQLMDLEISDLVMRMDADSRNLMELTEAQENLLVSDVRLLQAAFLVINGLSFEEIKSHFSFTEPELVRYLAKLDQIKLVELLPKNRIKRLISPNFAWRRNGPIQRFFVKNMQNDYFTSHFDSTGEAFVFLSGLLSQNSNASLCRKIEQLAGEFNHMNREDSGLSFEKRFAYSMVVAIRPWRPSVFEGSIGKK
jgi:transcriptional regulator with XRE-family HTH domain